MRSFRKVDALARAHNLLHVVVYIEEAHAQDGWKCYAYVDYDAPRSQQERNALAATLVHASTVLPHLVLVDLVGRDEAEKNFAAFPERLYVVENGMILFRGGIGPDNYLTGFEEFLLASGRNQRIDQQG